MTTDSPKRRPGRPPNPDSPTDSLGGVRVHSEQLRTYTQAAQAAGTTRAAWIRSTLDRAARRLTSPCTVATETREASER